MAPHPPTNVRWAAIQAEVAPHPPTNVRWAAIQAEVPLTRRRMSRTEVGNR